MPWGVKKVGGKYKVFRKDGGKEMPGGSASHAKAEARIRAVEAHEHGYARESYGAGCGSGAEPPVRREEYAKAGKPVNPFAVCTSSVGRKDKSLYERCVKDVKAKAPIKD